MKVTLTIDINNAKIILSDDTLEDYCNENDVDSVSQEDATEIAEDAVADILTNNEWSKALAGLTGVTKEEPEYEVTIDSIEFDEDEEIQLGE